MATVTINSFIEDTSVLVAGVYLVVRGPLERLIKSSTWVGFLAGAFAASEAAFPGERFPYDPPVLACSFAVAIGGVRAGAIAAVCATVSSLAFLSLQTTNVIEVQVLLTLAVMGIFGRWLPGRWWAVVLSAIAHAGSIPLSMLISKSAPYTLTSFASVPANAFGLVLLLLVIRDATLREESYRHAREILEARRVAAEAQLAIVRTRVQPHFLFNALNSISALCTISPQRAAEATTNLGHLMRRSLEIDLGKSLDLGEELSTVRSYLAVEQERFGSKLKVHYEIDEMDGLRVPAFSVQILVENAVAHGITPRATGGRLCVLARRTKTGATICVSDDGVGIVDENRDRSSPHGLSILKDQLLSICGPSARLHVVRRPSGGTLAVFHIPVPEPNLP